MATRDPIQPTRRALLAGVAILPAAPALSLDVQGRVSSDQVAYLANNLRRADDMAQRIGAPLPTADCWHWLARHAENIRDLEPLDCFELHADISGMSWRDRLELRPKCLKLIELMKAGRLRMSDLV